MSTAVLKGKITLNDSMFQAGLRRAKSSAMSIGRDIGGRLKSFITSPLGAASAAIGAFFSYETFKSGIEAVIETGGELYRLHRMTGIAVGSLSALKSMAGLTETPFTLVSAAVIKMQKALFAAAKGGGPAIGVLRMLKLDIDDIKGLKPEEQFKRIGERIADLPDPMARTAAAMSIFGRSGAELIPLFYEMDSVDFGNLSDKAKILERNAEIFHGLTVNFRKAQINLKNVFIGSAAALAPTLFAIAKFLSSKNALNFGKTLGQGIDVAVKTLIGAFSNPGKLLDGFFLYAAAESADWLNKLSSWLLGSVVRFGEGMVMVGSISKNIGVSLVAAAIKFGSGLLVGVSKAGAYLWAALDFAFQKSLEFFDGSFKDSIRSAVSLLRDGLKAALKSVFGAMAKLPGLPTRARAALQNAFSSKPEMKEKQPGFKAESWDAVLKRGMDQSAFLKAGETGLQIGENMIGEAWKNISEALAKFQQGSEQAIGSMVTLDIFGAGEYRKKAKAALDAVRQVGEQVLKPYSPSTETKKNPWQRFGNFASFGAPMLSSGSLASTGGLGDPLKFGLNSAYAKTALISARDRRTFEDAAVARGGLRTGTNESAFNVVRRGDKERRRAFEMEQQKQKLGIDKTNSILSEMLGELQEFNGQ